MHPATVAGKVETLMDKRSEQDVAHAKLSTGDIDKTDVGDCAAIAKLVIINYLNKVAEAA